MIILLYYSWAHRPEKISMSSHNACLSFHLAVCQATPGGTQLFMGRDVCYQALKWGFKELIFFRKTKV